MLRSIIVVVALAAHIVAFGQSAPQPAPASPSNQTKDGFSGLLLITPDLDWKEKWDAPSSTTPNFNSTSVVRRGQKVFVLTFFSNPGLRAGQLADITCDVDVIRPDASVSTHLADAECFRRSIPGSPTSLYLSSVVLGFTADPGDLAGEWLVVYTLKENVRGTVLPLTATFTVVE